MIGLAEESIYIHPSYPYIFTVVHILAVSHTCYNPFIYCWMNIRVRQGFLDVLGKYSHFEFSCQKWKKVFKINDFWRENSNFLDFVMLYFDRQM